MRNMRFQLKTCLIFSMTFIAATAQAGLLRVGLKQALDQHLVSVKATGNGGYQGKKLKLEVENKSGSTLQLTMDQGIIFRPDDTTQQDLVLAGQEMLALQPFKSGSTDVETFCAKMHAGGPGAQQNFRFHKMGDEQLVKVLQYLKTNWLLDHLGQRAVWAMTDEKHLRGVYDEGRDIVSKKLIDFMASVTGWPKPDYYAIRAVANEPLRPAIPPKALKIFADYQYILEAPKSLTLGVYDAQGNMIQKVFENQTFRKAGHRWTVTFEASNVATGKYYIRLKEGETILKETMVQVD